jgi:hypothetical protein
LIPEDIITFLEGATVAFAGTRDRDLMPHVHRVSAWLIGKDRETMTCLIPNQFAKHLVSSLKDNGQFAVTVTGSTTGRQRSNPPRPYTDAHETYQFKGEHLSSRSVNNEDLDAYRSAREQFAKLFAPLLNVPEGVAAKFILQPDLAVTFRVREIFIQTPGPNAGRRLVPPEDQ